MNKMLQYLLWTNCNNNCEFCIRGDKSDSLCLKEMIQSVDKVIANIDEVNWSDFPLGVSVIGGEIFYITDTILQLKIKELIEKIIKKVILPSKTAHLLLITNLLYNISFLYTIIDLFKDNNILDRLNIHTSFDLKYRFITESSKNLFLSNLSKLKKDNPQLNVIVQSILTQYLINAVNNKEFNILEFENKYNIDFALLVPLDSNKAHLLEDFFPKRSDFLKFILKVYDENPFVFRRFICSARYAFSSKEFIDSQYDSNLEPNSSFVLNYSLMKCGHSDIYKIYKDDNTHCLLCDLEALTQRGGSNV